MCLGNFFSAEVIILFHTDSVSSKYTFLFKKKGGGVSGILFFLFVSLAV